MPVILTVKRCWLDLTLRIEKTARSGPVEDRIMSKASRIRVGLGAGVSLMCTVLLMAGCLKGSPPRNPSCLSCDDTHMVRIQPATKETIENEPGLSHPFHLTRKDWGLVLRSVKVRSLHLPLFGRSYTGAMEPAFNEDEVRYLGESLSQAFQEVTLKEWVAFALSRIGETGLPQLTSGAWFVRNDQLHLKLANYRVTVTLPGIRKEIWSDPLSVQPGIFYELVASDHQGLITDHDTRANPFRPAASHLSIDLVALTGHRQDEVAQPEGTTPAVSPLEDTLRTLKRLHEQGLINEEEYQIKKRQLLDRL